MRTQQQGRTQTELFQAEVTRTTCKLWQMSTAATHTPRLGCSHARHGIYSPNWMTYTHMYTRADEIGGLLRKHRLWYCSCTAGTCASARAVSSILSPDKCQASQGPGQTALTSWCTDELDLERDWAAAGMVPMAIPFRCRRKLGHCKVCCCSSGAACHLANPCS
jgi:hypothetical protein